MSRILALLGGPRAARGRLRRRPPSAAAALRAVGLASLGLAELRKCLIRGKHRRMQSRQGGQGRQGRQAGPAGKPNGLSGFKHENCPKLSVWDQIHARFARPLKLRFGRGHIFVYPEL